MTPVPQDYSHEVRKHDSLAGRVVFAGLGDFGRYGAEVQRLAAANVTRYRSR